MIKSFNWLVILSVEAFIKKGYQNLERWLLLQFYSLASWSVEYAYFPYSKLSLHSNRLFEDENAFEFMQVELIWILPEVMSSRQVRELEVFDVILGKL